MSEGSPRSRPIGGGEPGDWWGAIDREILECLAERGVMTLDELCSELGVSPGEATAFVAMLARQGRVRICQVELAA